MSIGNRLRSRRKMFGYTLKVIAEHVGVKQPTVSQWEADLMVPRGESLKKLEDILKTNSDWILHGKGNPEARYVLVQPDSQEFKAISLSTKRIPVISWVQAGAWSDTGCDDPAMACSEWMETSSGVSEHAFALIVRGDSMTNSSNPRSIQDGAKVVVEPIFDPEQLNRKIVVAMLEGSSEATIKEFIQDGPVKFLKPLNPAYPSMQINGNCRIVGVVKQIVVDL